LIAPSEAAKDDLLAAIPSLRAFATSLSGSASAPELSAGQIVQAITAEASGIGLIPSGWAYARPHRPAPQPATFLRRWAFRSMAGRSTR